MCSAISYELDNGQIFSEASELRTYENNQQAIFKSGSYSFVGADGQTYWVNYYADDKGFHPTIGKSRPLHHHHTPITLSVCSRKNANIDLSLHSNRCWSRWYWRRSRCFNRSKRFEIVDWLELQHIVIQFVWLRFILKSKTNECFSCEICWKHIIKKDSWEKTKKLGFWIHVKILFILSAQKKSHAWNEITLDHCQFTAER